MDAPPTVTVTNDAGATVATGTGTLTEPDTGTYTYLVPSQATPTRLTVLAVGSVGAVEYRVSPRVDVVSARLFALPELRAFDRVLDDTAKFPAADLAEVRDFVEQRFTEITGRAFVQTYARDTGRINAGETLVLSRPYWRSVLSVSRDGTDITADVVADLQHGDSAYDLVLDTVEGWRSGTYSVAYVHGEDSVPADIRRAAMQYARSLLLSTGATINERALQMQTPAIQGTPATLDLAIPGQGRFYTGIPDVDVVLSGWRMADGVA